jgi:hypothetical protein
MTLEMSMKFVSNIDIRRANEIGMRIDTQNSYSTLELTLIYLLKLTYILDQELKL